VGGRLPAARLLVRLATARLLRDCAADARGLLLRLLGGDLRLAAKTLLLFRLLDNFLEDGRRVLGILDLVGTAGQHFVDPI